MGLRGPKPSGHALTNAERQRQWKARQRDNVIFLDALPVTCWCERDIVYITRRELLAGLTASCGHRSCQPNKAS